jgi:hypothetical protein
MGRIWFESIADFIYAPLVAGQSGLEAVTCSIGAEAWNSMLRPRRLKILHFHPMHGIEVVHHSALDAAAVGAFAAALVRQIEARVLAFVLAGAAVIARTAVDKKFVRHTTFT